MNINISKDKSIYANKCIEDFIKDCADVCTAKKVNSFIDAVGKELMLYIYKKYHITVYKSGYAYLFIGYNRKNYIIKFDSYPTAVYFFWMHWFR